MYFLYQRLGLTGAETRHIRENVRIVTVDNRAINVDANFVHNVHKNTFQSDEQFLLGDL